MELAILTQMPNLKGYNIKEVITDTQITLILEKDGFPVCPKCKQLYFETIKDKREFLVEDLSVFGKMCF